MPKSAIRPFSVATLAVLGLWAVPAAAQQPLEMPTLLDPARLGPVQFKIVSGRIVMTGLRYGTHSTQSTGRGRTERLTLGVNNNEPVMSYNSKSSTEELSIEISGGSRLRIQRLPKGSSEVVPVDFQQAGGPITLTVGPKDKQRVYRAASLWHLLIAERDDCRQHLVPLVKILHRDWDLMKTVDQVEAVLLGPATARDLPDRRRWATLVEQLGDSRFAQREAADRQLREAGRAVLPYLRQLDASRLDAEQRYRIRRIMQAFSGSEDVQSPDQVAAWLSGDPAIWLIYLARNDESTRRLAAGRLEILLGQPIPFNPAADAPTRARQLARLRQQYSGQ